jgi:hypothetical protein
MGILSANPWRGVPALAGAILLAIALCFAAPD